MPEYIIGIRITSTSDTAALEAARRQLGLINAEQLKVQSTTKATGGAFSTMAAGVKGAFLAVGAGMVSLAGLVSQLMAGTRAALEKMKAMRQLSMAVASFGQDGKAAAKAAAELGDSVERLGIDDLQVIEGVRNLVFVTRDYTEALTGAALAADMAAARGVDYETALQTIRDLLVGSQRGVTAAVKLFGVEATTAQGALDALAGTFTGFGATIQGVDTVIEQSRATWNQFWEDIGDGAITAAARLIDFASQVKTAFADLNVNVLKKLMAVVDMASRGDLIRALKVLGQTQEQMSGPAADGTLPISPETLRTGPPKQLKAREDSDDLARQAKLAEDAANKARGIFADQMEESQKLLDEWTANWNDALSELAAARADYAKQTNASVAQQLAFELQALDMQKAQELEKVKGNADAALLVEQTYSLRRQAMLSKAGAERERMEVEQAVKIAEAQQLVIDQMERELELKLQLTDLTDQERLAILEMLGALRQETAERAYNILLLQQEQELKNAKPEERPGIETRQAKERAAAEQKIVNTRVQGEQAVRAEGRKTLQWEEISMEQKAQLAAAATQQVLGQAQQVFGESKALSIASAIINTYVAATKALAELGPAGPPVAAALIALGMAMVAKIAASGKSSEGSGGRAAGGAGGRGFDDPEHDRMAYMGGKKWAGDMVREYTAGWRDGMKQGGDRPASINVLPAPVTVERAAAAIVERWNTVITEITERVERGSATTLTNTTNVANQTVDNSRGASVVVNQSILWGPSAREGAKALARLVDRGDRRARRTRVAAGPQKLGGE